MYNCNFCEICNGRGCLNKMPGMGGVNNSANFILNCDSWKKYHKKENLIPDGFKVRLAPMTGAVENVGYDDERQFYKDLVNFALSQNAKLGIGDGTPDEKLLWGIEAVKEVGKKSAVFIKPYPNEKIMERLEWAQEIAEIGGIDIDAYNIVTMRNKVHLEKKTPEKMKELKSFFNKKGIPFAIKGIFTKEDLELVQEVHPDVCYISNHGGRVENGTGSTADYLAENSSLLKKNCGKLWVDGGIRTESDINAAIALGADEVLKGRPFATGTCRLHKQN